MIQYYFIADHGLQPFPCLFSFISINRKHNNGTSASCKFIYLGLCHTLSLISYVLSIDPNSEMTVRLFRKIWGSLMYEGYYIKRHAYLYHTSTFIITQVVRKQAFRAPGHSSFSSKLQCIQTSELRINCHKENRPHPPVQILQSTWIPQSRYYGVFGLGVQILQVISVVVGPPPPPPPPLK